MEQIFFYIFAIVAVASAIAVISVRNPVHSALYLIVCFLQVAAIFILLRSPFLAAVQVFIYVGAVMVLFLFAVMVLDIGKESFGEHMHSQAIPAGITVLGLLAVVGWLISKGKITVPLGNYTEAVLTKNTEVVGKSLYTQFIFPFEVVSLLLLIALIGAIVLVMKEKGKGAGSSRP
jgi:NADH-quinone oxidoreductase subunit J